MTTTIARIKKAGKRFEIVVDLDDAIKVKKGESSSIEPEGDKIFTDHKKGFVAPVADLQEAFKTTNPSEIAVKIIREGEVQLTQDYRDEEREKKLKQVVDFLTRNAIDPKSGMPITENRIKTALDEAHVNLKNVPLEQQISEVVEALSKIMPIKLETKRIKIVIPAIYTGKAYGIVNQYKVQEDWMNDGSLKVVVEIPSGIVMDFYDKLNSITHGSALTEDMKND